jgi:hypothetical protein
MLDNTSIAKVTAALDFEQEFINHLANLPSLEYILREGISPDLLLSPRTKSVFTFVTHHFNASGRLPGAKTLKQEFPKLEFEEPETTVQYVVEKLRDRYQRNEIGELIEAIAEVTVKDPKEAMSRLRQAAFEIDRNSTSNRHLWLPGDHKLFLRNLQQQVLAGAFNGTTCGYAEIDKFTGGIKDGNLAYLLAREKRMKTFNVCMAFIGQARDGRNPYFATLENTEQEIMLRISCILSGYSWDLAQRGIFTAKDYKMIDKAWEEFSQHKFAIEMPPMDERTVPALVSKADKVGAEAIIISQFKYIKGVKDFYRSETEEKAEVAIDLKQAAVRPGAERPFYVEAQFNRGGDSMEELEDFDGSKVGLTDMIGQAADTLYGIFQNKDLRANNTLEFGILTARNHGKASWYIQTELVNKTEFKVASRR